MNNNESAEFLRGTTSSDGANRRNATEPTIIKQQIYKKETFTIIHGEKIEQERIVRVEKAKQIPLLVEIKTISGK